MVSFSSRRTEDDSAPALFFLGAMVNLDVLIKANVDVGLCIAATDSMLKMKSKKQNDDSRS